jgi:F0F1-type ATP synthase delta subunit
MSDELCVITDERLGRVRLKVTTAYEPSPAELEEMARRLGVYFGKKAIIERAINPALIGGFTVEGNDTLIDMSVKGQISRIIGRV